MSELPGDSISAAVAFATRMATFPGSWSLCGGWAVDAWVGSETRPHLDVDIAMWRDDERALFETLSDWGLVAHDTDDAVHKDPWDGHALRFPAHLHAGMGGPPPEGDIQLNERQGDRWVLSREPRVTLPVERFALATDLGISLLAPEAILFFKSDPRRREHDDLDFDALLPLLDAGQREWLASVIVLFDAHHPWLERLK